MLESAQNMFHRGRQGLRRISHRLVWPGAVGALLAWPMLTSLLCVSLVLGLVMLAPLPAVAATTVGSGQIVGESRSVAVFSAVELASPLTLRLRPGAEQTIQVRGDENLLPLLETVVENRSGRATLLVRFKRNSSVYTRSKITVEVVVPALEAALLSGSGDLLIDGFKLPALELALNGSGDIKAGSLSIDKLKLRLAGSGDLRVRGQAGQVSINLAGSGDVHAAELQARDVIVKLAGSGDVAVQAQDTLDVNIVGSGDVQYSGAAKLTSRIAGNGSIKRR